MSLNRDSYTNQVGIDPLTGTIAVYSRGFNTDARLYRVAIAGPPNSFGYLFVGPAELVGSVQSFEDISYFGQNDSADFPAGPAGKPGLYIRAGYVVAMTWWSIASPASQAAPVKFSVASPGDAKMNITWEDEPNALYEGGGGVTETRQRYRF